MKQEFFLTCDCDQEGLQFERYGNETELWISHWSRSHKTDPLWDRIKMAWRIITGQEVDLWTIVLSPTKFEELRKFLDRIK